MSEDLELVDETLRVLRRVVLLDQFSSTLSIALESFFVEFGIEEWREEEEEGCLLLSLEQFTIRIRAPSLSTTV